ncbi:MAG: nitroreductase family protein [Planctomycetota bacterium]|nr:MAG: nitroreductase family protein [Planctomycetota bacterium]
MLYETLKARRSIRKFKPEKPDRELIEKLIEAAITAPSGSNKQPWKFIVISNAEVIDRIAKALHKTMDRFSEHVTERYKYAFRVYEKYFSKFEGAPMVIVPLYQNITVISKFIEDDMPAKDRDRILRMEQHIGLISASLALENLCLMAHDLGLGTCIMSGPLVAPDEIREILGIDSTWEPLSIVPVGYPDEDPKPPPRKPVENILKWIE